MIYTIHYILKPDEIREVVRDHLSRFGVDKYVADRIAFLMSRGYDPESLVFWLQEVGLNEIHARILTLLVTERLMAEASRRAVLYQAFHSVVMMPATPPADQMKSAGGAEHPPPQSISRNSEINLSTGRQDDLASRVLKEIKILKKKILTYEKEAIDRESRKAFQKIVAMLEEEHEAMMSLFRSRLQTPGPCEGYRDEYYRFLCITARGAVDFVKERRFRSAIVDLARIIQVLMEE